MPSLRRDAGSTSIAMVLLATVAAPNGPPCSVRITANASNDAPATYPPKNTKLAVRQASSMVLRGKLSTMNPLNGRISSATTE